jgi:hypothetical protein
MTWKSILGASLFCVAATPASAGWQYTQWNMSPEDAVKASAGSMVLGSGEAGQRLKGYEVGAVGSYKAGSRTFKATFYFKSRKLSLIMLETTEAPRCYSLANDLKGVYGKPFDSSSSSITVTNTWHDNKAGNFVALLAIGDQCSLTYKPLVSDDAAGL